MVEAELLTFAEVGKILSRSKASVKRFVKLGQLTATGTTSNRRITRASVSDFIKKEREAAEIAEMIPNIGIGKARAWQRKQQDRRILDVTMSKVKEGTPKENLPDPETPLPLRRYIEHDWMDCGVFFESGMMAQNAINAKQCPAGKDGNGVAIPDPAFHLVYHDGFITMLADVQAEARDLALMAAAGKTKLGFYSWSPDGKNEHSTDRHAREKAEEKAGQEFIRFAERDYNARMAAEARATAPFPKAGHP